MLPCGRQLAALKCSYPKMLLLDTGREDDLVYLSI